MNGDNRPALIPYESTDGSIKLDIQLDGDTVWLTQDQLVTLFATTKQNISKHIGNIFTEGELKSEQSVNEKLTLVGNGRRYRVQHYNLDVVISVGYRINSVVATRFRQWATQTLKEYMVKGFVMDDKRLAEAGNTFAGRGYFDELLERVRKIRSSEKMFYEKVKAVFSVTSVDYDPKALPAKEFYATMQNKFHFAVTGQTAAEIVSARIDAGKPHAGLTNFSGVAPTTSEAKIAKNFMMEEELKRLYLISEQFMSFAELKVQNQATMTMADWSRKLDEMLRLNDLEVLNSKGSVSHEKMDQKVRAEMEKYRAVAKLANGEFK